MAIDLTRTCSGVPVMLTFSGAPVRAVVQIVAVIAELALMLSPTVSGTTSLDFAGVPWDGTGDQPGRNLHARQGMS